MIDHAHLHHLPEDEDCPQVIGRLEVLLVEHPETGEVRVALCLDNVGEALTDTQVVQLRTALDVALVAVHGVRRSHLS